jgi:hypothetical protein
MNSFEIKQDQTVRLITIDVLSNIIKSLESSGNMYMTKAQVLETRSAVIEKYNSIQSQKTAIINDSLK